VQDRRQYFPLLFTNFDFKVQTQTDHNKQNKHDNKQTGEKKKKNISRDEWEIKRFFISTGKFHI